MTGPTWLVIVWVLWTIYCFGGERHSPSGLWDLDLRPVLWLIGTLVLAGVALGMVL